MEKVTKTIICDMCGAEIDTSDDRIIVKSAISSGFYGVLVHEYNSSYNKGFRTRISHLNIDLCPACADRATRIHCEVVPTDDGRSCHHVLSWRDDCEAGQ